MNIVENYLSMLCGEDNIVYLHATTDKELNEVSVATVTDLGKTYHLLYTKNSNVVINKTYSNILTISRILRDLQPD